MLIPVIPTNTKVDTMMDNSKDIKMSTTTISTMTKVHQLLVSSLNTGRVVMGMCYTRCFVATRTNILQIET